MKHLFMTIAMAAALTACGHRASTDGSVDADSVSIDSTAIANEVALKTDSIGIELADTMVEVHVSVAWPVEGNDTLLQGIRQYIMKQLGIKKCTDIKAELEKIAKIQYNELKTQWQEDREERGIYAGGMIYSSYQRITVDEESDTYVTYSYYTEGFTGGAHGYATATGMTISKATGKQIGYESEYDTNTESFSVKHQNLFRSTKSAGLYKLIKEGVRDYFSEVEDHKISDAELADILQNVPDVNHIPVPQFPPTFSKKGLLFLYQQYEIGPYAVGMPNFCIPYEAIKPYLNDEALELLK